MERIILALDGMNGQEAFKTANKFSDAGIWGVKINDLLEDNNPQEIIPALKKYGENGTRVFADAKLHDTPQTVFNSAKKLAAAGADFITVHTSGGIDMMTAAVDAAKGTSAKILAVTVLTSLSEEETYLNYGGPAKAKVLQFARDATLAGVYGVVCSPQELEFLNPRRELRNLIKITPSIRLDTDDTHDQKRIGTPTNAIINGADFLVIGRPILKAENMLEALDYFNSKIYAALKEKLALDLFDNGNVKFGAFKLKLHEKKPDAPLSPIYLNLRDMPEKFYEISAELMAEIIKRYKKINEKYSNFCNYYIAGIPRAGEPFAEKLRKLLNRKVLKLKKNENSKGRKITTPASLTTQIIPNMGCVLVDDVITEADSKIEAISALEEIGVYVDLIIVLVDRKQGGMEKIISLNNPYRKGEAIYSLTQDLLPLYLDRGKITREQRLAVLNYISENKI